MIAKFLKSVFRFCLRSVLKLLLFFLVSSVLSVVLLRYIPAPMTTFMLYQHVSDWRQGKDFTSIDHEWVEHEQISKHIFSAVIAAEDQKFYQHHGFDTEAMQLAVANWLDGGRLRGASTISQQLAKNLFLIPTRHLLRKVIEAWFTLLIEIFWDKQRILDVYVNSVEFGDHLFGVESASRHFFGIPAKQLNRKQSALLAAALPNPKQFNVAKPSVYMFKRQSWILKQMRNLGY